MKDEPPHAPNEAPESSEKPEEPQAPSSGGRRATIDDDRLRAILRQSVPRTAAPSLLGGVQRRIRDRSRGRFYADGWSRSRQTTSTYVITSLLALGIFLLAYFVLLPSLPMK